MFMVITTLFSNNITSWPYRVPSCQREQLEGGASDVFPYKKEGKGNEVSSFDGVTCNVYLAKEGADDMDSSYKLENLGTIVEPRCGACRCGKCPIPGLDTARGRRGNAG